VGGIENELLARDFDIAVTNHLYVHERKEAWRMMREQARLIAYIMLTGKMPDEEDAPESAWLYDAEGQPIQPEVEGQN
jgi:hypothetical protein